MGESKELLQKIAALRIRLDQAQTLIGDVAAPIEKAPNDGQDPVSALAQAVRQGRWHNQLLADALRSVEPAARPMVPSRLTHRAARVVHRARDLLQELRALAEDSMLRRGDDDPLADLHGEATSMIDTVLRTVQGFPPSPAAQQRLCTGPEAILDVVGERMAAIKAGMRLRSVEASRIDRLADALRRFAAGQPVDVSALDQLAEEVLDDARQGRPLRFPSAIASDPAQATAAHGLAVAQVLARITPEDTEGRRRPTEGIVAALVHDVGMVGLPAEIGTQAGALSEEQRKLVERHTQAGAQALAKVWPGGGLAIDAAADHHERVDGTGYPRGERALQLSEEVRLLALCDVYAALASSRSWRPAVEPRTALADTLLGADRGALDKQLAQRLLRLGFHPAGSAVELDDGSVGLVVAPQTGARAEEQAARPIVAIVRESFGQAPAAPRTLDLARRPERTIVRSLTLAERREVLGRHFPELV